MKNGAEETYQDHTFWSKLTETLTVRMSGFRFYLFSSYKGPSPDRKSFAEGECR